MECVLELEAESPAGGAVGGGVSVAAFERYYNEFHPEICRQIGARVNCSHTASDLAHDVFVRFIQYTKRNAVENVGAFLRMCANNAVIDYYRYRALRPNLNLDIVDIPDMLPSNDVESERALIARQAFGIFRKHLDDMPKLRQDIIVLHFVEGLRQSEIAKKFGVCQSTVEKNIRQVRMQLSQLIELET